jgi:predicted component of type VI protein secretion system
MKVSLVVAEGPHKGKTIPVSRSQFFIGRDPTCQLRPASGMISRRHCVLLLRGDQVFVRDFGSTNGTRVNDERVQGEIEIHHDDRLTIEPLHFVIRVEKTFAINRRTPIPPFKTTVPEADDASVAEILLSLQTGNDTATGPLADVPEGSTIIQAPAELAAPEGKIEKPEDKDKSAANHIGDTSVAAQAILSKYSKRRKRKE